MNSRPSLHRLATLLCLFTLLAACGDAAPNPPGLSTQRRTIAGTVVLPPGVAAATVVNGLGTAPVTDGAFTLEVFAGADDARQFAIALSPSGAPLLMGWFGSQRSTLSARTTAEVLVWFAGGGFTVPFEVAAPLLAAIGEAPQLDTLATAIDAALTAQPGGLVDPDPTLAAALGAAVADILPTAEPRPVPRALLINPAADLSGVRLDQVSGVNQVTLVNRYRRPAFALIDRVSTFDADGKETAAPKSIARVDLAAVTGLDGGIGTINQIITGLATTGGTFEGADLAYTEKASGAVALPNVEGAAKTRYHIAVVGPGGSEGDIAELSDEARRKQTEVVQKFAIQQLILPLVLQFLIPTSDLDKVSGLGGFGDLVGDFINIVAVQAPAIFERASTGDLKGAVTLGAQTIVGSATFRNALFEAVLERLYDLSTEAGDAAYGRASAAAAGFVQVTGAIDTLFTAFDLTAVAANFAQSNTGDLWVVDASGAIVRLSPPDSTIETGDTIRLTATLPDVGDDVPLAYRFTVEPTDLGQLGNSRTSGTRIDTSENFIDFTAGETEGTVTVKVEVFQIDNANRIALGAASATIVIQKGCGFGDEDRQTVTVQHWTGITAPDAAGTEYAIAYWYFVFELTPEITGYDLTFRAGPAGDLFGSTTIQRDGNTIRIRPVQPSGDHDLRYSTAESLPRREYDEFAAAVALTSTQGIYVLVDSSQGLNDTRDQLESFQERVGEIDAKNAGTKAEIIPACN